MQVIPTELPEVLIIEPKVFRDDRGFFLESYRLDQYQEQGVKNVFVQDNHSQSKAGVLRGLHYQLRHPQGKLLRVVQGEIFDVAVDIRKGSPNFGKWVGVLLSAENHRQLYVPPGFAHGFCVMSETTDCLYRCTDYYNPDDEHSIRWDDPDIGIQWPVTNPELSAKDQASPYLKDAGDDLPVYQGVS